MKLWTELELLRGHMYGAGLPLGQVVPTGGIVALYLSRAVADRSFAETLGLETRTSAKSDRVHWMAYRRHQALFRVNSASSKRGGLELP